MSKIDLYMRHAAHAIARRQPGPAHRHLMRAWDAEGGMTDDQIDRWVELSDRLDPIELAAGMRHGQPIEEVDQ